jgi:hypothetical protein
MGAIVCSLALLSGTINESETDSPSILNGVNGDSNYNPAPSAMASNIRPDHDLLTPPGSRPMTPTTEAQQPLLPSSEPTTNSKSLSHLRGSIAGTYSLAGGAGILLLTKLGGALFDSAGPGSPFYMMAAFNGVLFAATLAIAVKQGFLVAREGAE